MRRLSFDELLKVTATPMQALKSLRRRDQIALAFGRRAAYESLSYLELDAVGLLLTDALGRAYPNLTEAAQQVRVWFDIWAAVVGEAEADLKTDASFCIVDLERENDGKIAHMACGARDATPEQIAATLEATPQGRGLVAVRVNCVNVSHLIRFIRKTAAKHHIEMRGAFMFPPSDPRFAEIMAPYTELRDQAVVEVRARKNREALARMAGEKARKIMEASLH